jgi:hypothetical protein
VTVAVDWMDDAEAQALVSRLVGHLQEAYDAEALWARRAAGIQKMIDGLAEMFPSVLPDARSAYAPVGDAEPTHRCPEDGCTFVARGETGLGVHRARAHGTGGLSDSTRRARRQAGTPEGRLGCPLDACRFRTTSPINLATHISLKHRIDGLVGQSREARRKRQALVDQAVRTADQEAGTVTALPDRPPPEPVHHGPSGIPFEHRPFDPDRARDAAAKSQFVSENSV